MVEIDDLYGTGRLAISDVPSPNGFIAEDNLFVGEAPTTLRSFGVETLAKLLCRFNRAGVGG
jgi:hypothetical protein